MTDIKQSLLLEELINKAKTAGADTADALFVESRSLSVAQRLGSPESIERSESHDLGLRVFIGRRNATISTTDIKTKSLDTLIERVVSMAKVAPEDPFARIATKDEITISTPNIDLFDPSEPTAQTLIERASLAEEAALAVKGVTNSEGGEAAWSATKVILATSNGFYGTYERSGHSLSAVVLAGTGQNMERDYEYSSTVYQSDLDDPTIIGKRAGERAVKRLNPKKPGSSSIPVIYDPRVSGSLIGHLSSALNGSSIARGTSFLKNAMGDQIFSSNIQVFDDPHRPRGLRSKPFDGEGLANKKCLIIENGIVKSWFLDLATAGQLGLTSSGHASRSTGGAPNPSPSNLFLAAGESSPADLISDIKKGLYVTELMGMSVNMVTGDYSRGAGGFWIENGKITYPVSDITVAGNLRDMFAKLIPASDLEFKRGTDAPTVRIDGMTVAGPGN
jgi:PmbA protein